MTKRLQTTSLAWFMAVFTWFAQPMEGGAEPLSEPLGGCLIVQVRKGSRAAPSLDSFCGRVPALSLGGQPWQQLYAWAPPFLAAAFDQAERAHCSGKIGCVVGDRSVRLALFADGFPNAFVAADAARIDVGISTGLVDFVDAATRSFIRDAKSQGSASDGFGNWLQRMHDAGGSPCPPRIAPPATDIPVSEFVPGVQAPAQLVYYFIFAHELAHVVSGGNCHAGAGDALTVEKACDRIGMTRLTESNLFFPALIVPWMTAMQYYEALDRPDLERVLALDAGSFRAMFPAREWARRGDGVLDSWTNVCQSGSSEARTVVCRAGWQSMFQLSRALLDLPRPLPCVDRAAAEPSVGSCRQLLELIRASDSGFRELNGEVTFTDEDGGKTFAATKAYANGRDCEVMTFSDLPPSYQCELYRGKDQTAGASAFAALKTEMRNCFSQSWTATQETEERKHSVVTTMTLEEVTGGRRLEAELTRRKTSGEVKVTLSVDAGRGVK